ncbi:hypothetical protein DOJK_00097 [Patescibacteria group bacterium]|nr:hypothetical protein DOJK_00097 [Patescibacteria group bacterium]
MKKQVIIDTGVLVAYLSEADNYHAWAVKQLEQISPPLLTCEAVITEACFLLYRNTGTAEVIIELLQEGLLKIVFNLADESRTIIKLMHKYKNVPMSLADACLVRMTELYPQSELLTLDSDFYIYRKHNNQPISLIIP